jgi:hypothetical protein
MKHKSIFTIFAALTMVLGFAMTGLGQQNDNAVLAANATVVGAIDVAVVQTLEFGNLSVSGPKTIDLAGAESGGVTGGTVRQGIYSITKGANTSVDLSFTSIPANLDITPAATALLPITYVAAWTANAGSGLIGGTPVVVTQGVPTVVPQLTAAAIIYVHLGGTVTPGGAGPTATIAGTYAGNITLQAEFN